MITLELSNPVTAFGPPNEVAQFYAMFLCYFRIMGKSVKREEDKQAALDYVLEQMKNIKIERMDDDQDQGDI